MKKLLNVTLLALIGLSVNLGAMELDLTATDIHGNLALHWAASDGHLDMVQKILGAAQEQALRQASSNTMSSYMLMHRELGDVSWKGYRYDIEQEALEIVKNYINTKSAIEYTPLRCAVEQGHTEVVKLLLEAGADVTTPDPLGRHDPLLHKAAEHNDDVAIVELLLAAGTPIDQKDRYGRTALWIAVTKDAPAVVAALIKGKAQLNEQDFNGYTPLLHAAYNGKWDIVALLLEAGANPNLQDTARGYTALHWAVCFDDADAVQTLLNAGANVYIKDKEGKTALERAREGQCTASLPLLTEATNRMHIQFLIN